MRTAVTSPFTPGSDAVPEVWAGRSNQLSDWRDTVRPRRLAGLYERGRTILGEPGLGKSALVRRIAADAAASGDWITPQLRIPSGADPLKLVADAILALADTAGLGATRERSLGDLIERVRSVAAAGVSLTIDKPQGPEPFAAMRELLIEVALVAMRRNHLVVMHIDEVQNITNQDALSQLLIALGDVLAHETEVEVPGGVMIRRFLPLVIYLTGLPDFEDVAGARKGATFARRFKTDVLSAIDDADLEAALRPFVVDGWEVADGRGGLARIRMDAAAAQAIVELSRGEPFLFQLAGAGAWIAGASDRISIEDVRAGWRSSEREAYSHVERILDRLPTREREFLEAMAALPAEQRSLTLIAANAGFAKTTDAGTTTRRLDTVRGIIDRGRPYSFRHRAVEAYLTSDWPRLS